jgi:hypothetical protein
VCGLQSGLDPGLERGGNIDIVVRRDPATGDTTAFSSTAGAVLDDPRGRARVRWPILEPYAGEGACPCGRPHLRLASEGRREDVLSLPARNGGRVVARTDGVPLFVEELTKSVLESGLLADAGDHYELAGPLPPLAIPTTLHDSLMARLDRLAGASQPASVDSPLEC